MIIRVRGKGEGKERRGRKKMMIERKIIDAGKVVTYPKS